MVIPLPRAERHVAPRRVVRAPRFGAAAEIEDWTGQLSEVLVDQSKVVGVLMLSGAEEIDVLLRVPGVRLSNIARVTRADLR